MVFRSEGGPETAVRANLMNGLRERLDAVEPLCASIRRALAAGDASSIESATARLETIALEVRVLADEFRRLPVPGRVEAADEALVAASRALRESALVLARSAAVTHGFLDRTIALRRGLLAAIASATGEGYLPTGRPTDLPDRSVRLRQRA
jgi:hypothetical protein